MAVADMHRVGPGDDSFGWPEFIGNGQIIAPEIELLEHQRHKRQNSSDSGVHFREISG